jgi:hypothetical protein
MQFKLGNGIYRRSSTWEGVRGEAPQCVLHESVAPVSKHIQKLLQVAALTTQHILSLFITMVPVIKSNTKRLVCMRPVAEPQMSISPVITQ